MPLSYSDPVVRLSSPDQAGGQASGFSRQFSEATCHRQ